MKSYPLLAACLAALFVSPFSLSAADWIDSITSSEGAPADATDTAGTLTSFSLNSTTYSTLVAPTTVTASGLPGDPWVAIETASMPGNGLEAVGGLNLDTGVLNADLTVQFGQTVTDSDLFFFILHNSGPPSPSIDAFTIQAINSGGGNVGSSASFGPIVAGPPMLVGERTWDRSGTSGDLNNREMYGYTITLSDLGLAGNTTVTGYSLTTSTFDGAVVGLAVVPEPAAGALLLSFGAGLLLFRRRARS